MNFSWVRLSPELAQTVSRVALAWHNAGGSTPFGVPHVMANAIRSERSCARGLGRNVESFDKALRWEATSDMSHEVCVQNLARIFKSFKNEGGHAKDPPNHRSHFGSRYTLGCCDLAGLF